MIEYKFNIEEKDLEEGKVDLAGLIERLGAIIAYYRGAGGSTYERTKEIWGSLQTLLKLPENRWSEWIELLPARYTPTDIGSDKDIELFQKLLKALLRKYSEEVRGYNPYMKKLLAKTIRDALDKVTSNPYPQICFFVKEFHPDRLNDKRFKRCEEVSKGE